MTRDGMKHSKDTTTIYWIKDDQGKVWKEFVGVNKHLLKQEFVRSWLSTIKIDQIDADTVWRIFERSGYEIVESEVKI